MALSSFIYLCLLLFINYNNGDKDGKHAVINNNDRHGDGAYVTQGEQSARWIRPKRGMFYCRDY